MRYTLQDSIGEWDVDEETVIQVITQVLLHGYKYGPVTVGGVAGGEANGGNHQLYRCM
jgi:hypothetical protein